MSCSIFAKGEELELLGSIPKGLEDRVALSEVSLSIPPVDLVVDWRRCGYVADFLAAYLALAFDDIKQATNLLSTIINELVENSVKYTNSSQSPIRICMRHYGDYIHLSFANQSNQAHVIKLRHFMESMVQEDAEELYFRQLEFNAQENVLESQLGLLSLKKDYKLDFWVYMNKMIDAKDAFLVELNVLIDVNQVETSEN
jgi:hypothetical protein